MTTRTTPVDLVRHGGSTNFPCRETPGVAFLAGSARTTASGGWNAGAIAQEAREAETRGRRHRSGDAERRSLREIRAVSVRGLQSLLGRELRGWH